MKIYFHNRSKEDSVSEAAHGYCLAVRSSLTDDGHLPLETPGLKLHERLTQIHSSLERVEKRGNSCKGRE